MTQLQQRMNYAISRVKTAEYEEAKIVLEQLLKRYTRHEQTDNIHLCLFHLAYIAYVRGEIHAFITLFQQFEQLKKEEHHASDFILRGFYMLEQQQYELAIEELTIAATLADDENNISVKVLALLSKGKCLQFLGRNEQALAIIDQVYSKHSQCIEEDTNLFFQFHLNRCDALFSLNRFDEAEAHLVACEAHTDFSLLAKAQARTLVARGKLFMAKKEPKRAIPSLQQAIVLCEDLEDSHLRNTIYEVLVDNNELLGKHKEALAFAKKQLQLQKTNSKIAFI